MSEFSSSNIIAPLCTNPNCINCAKRREENATFSFTTIDIVTKDIVQVVNKDHTSKIIATDF